MADGFHWNGKSDFAYHIGVTYSIYTKHADRWVIGEEYLEKRYDYKNTRATIHSRAWLLP